MPARYIAWVAAALSLMIAIPLKTFAEDAAKPSPAQIADGQSKAGVANALIILGRSAKDPDMLMTGAKILAGIDAPVADPKASSDGKPVFYDVDSIVAEAEGYAGNRAGKPASHNYAGLLPLRILVRQPELQLCLGLLLA